MAAPSTYVKVSGTYKKVNKMYTRVSGSWKEINSAYVRAGGVWKRIHTRAVGNDSFTKILLHMDGSNGGTTFTDTNAGGSAHTWSASSATTSTTSPKFGTAAGLFSAGQISTSDSADFTLGSGAWTVDFWMHRNGNGAPGSPMGIAAQWGNNPSGAAANSILIEMGTTSLVTCTISNGSTVEAVSAGALPSNNAWHHIAFVRSGNDMISFMNGTLVSTNSLGSYTIPNSSELFRIGAPGSVPSRINYTGFLDEFRLSVGIARWTSSFTPEVVAYGPG